MAWSPATPAPSTRTRAGVSVPAAVTSIGKNRLVATAASRTALYPATVAWDDSTSIGCARVIRGSNARLNAVTLRAASCDTVSRSADGWNSATRALASRHTRASCAEGGCTLRTTSLCPSTSAAEATSLAPAAPYASSPNDAASPAPRSTSNENPDFTSFPATSGVTATRRSLAAVSFGTPIFIPAPWRYWYRSAKASERPVRGPGRVPAPPFPGCSPVFHPPLTFSVSFPARAPAQGAAPRSRAAPPARRPAIRGRACGLRGPTHDAPTSWA